MLKFILLFLICFVLAGCPVTLNLLLTNDTDSTISVVYSTGYESNVEAGEVEKERYSIDCIRIKRSGNVYEFQATAWPPSEYVMRGVFSSSVNAVFMQHNKLKIYTKKNGKNNSFELKEGCE